MCVCIYICAVAMGAAGRLGVLLFFLFFFLCVFFFSCLTMGWGGMLTLVHGTIH